MHSISDEEQYSGIALHHPLLKYITDHAHRPVRDAFDENRNPDISVMGYEMFPLAVELSQWGFPINYIAEDEQRAKQAEIDSTRQAGKFQQIVAKYLTPAAITIWGGVMSNMKDEKSRVGLVKETLSYCHDLICSESVNINWERDLGKYYNVRIIRYYSNSYLILHITEK